MDATYYYCTYRSFMLDLTRDLPTQLLAVETERTNLT